MYLWNGWSSIRVCIFFFRKYLLNAKQVQTQCILGVKIDFGLKLLVSNSDLHVYLFILSFIQQMVTECSLFSHRAGVKWTKTGKETALLEHAS